MQIIGIISFSLTYTHLGRKVSNEMVSIPFSTTMKQITWSWCLPISRPHFYQIYFLRGLFSQCCTYTTFLLKLCDKCHCSTWINDIFTPRYENSLRTVVTFSQIKGIKALKGKQKVLLRKKEKVINNSLSRISREKNKGPLRMRLNLVFRAWYGRTTHFTCSEEA